MAKRLACWLLSPMSTTPLSARRKAGSYGLLPLLDRKLGNSQTASPERDARMPACGREGGGGIVVRPCGTGTSLTRRGESTEARWINQQLTFGRKIWGDSSMLSVRPVKSQCQGPEAGQV